jgi:ribosomal protein S18 acetylase RimI-like enzyme
MTVAQDVSIREATLDDFAAIRRVAAAANEELRQPMGERVYRGYLENIVDIEARAGRSIILVAEARGEVVGTVTLYPNANDEAMPVQFPPGTAGLRATAVSPDWRGRGIGRSLIRALIVRAETVRAGAIALHTAECMTAAIHLYGRLGFRRAPELDFLANDFLANGEGDRLEALAMVLPLDSADSFGTES